MSNARTADLDGIDAETRTEVSQDLFSLMDEFACADADTVTQTVSEEAVSLFSFLSEFAAPDSEATESEFADTVSREAFETVERNVLSLLSETYDSKVNGSAVNVDERITVFEQLLTILREDIEVDEDITMVQSENRAAA